MARTFGIDVSHWNGTINFDKAVLSGAKFVFMKCCDTQRTDSRFVVNWANAKAAGIMRGAYCFGNFLQYAKPQAEYFANMLKDDKGELPPVLDIEPWGGNALPSRLNLLKWIDDFMTTVYQSLGVRCLLYTNPAVIKHLLPIPTDLLVHDLWLAHYLNPLSIEMGWQPTFKPWTAYTFWQYTSHENGTKFGTQSLNVDGNYFNGDLDNLVAYSNKYTGGVIIPPPPQTINDRVTALETQARAHGWNV